MKIKEKKKFMHRITERAFGIWKDIKISSVDYVRKLRRESEKRMKKKGINSDYKLKLFNF